MKSGQLSTGLFLAAAGILMVISGCRSRQIYAPRPLTDSQEAIQLVSAQTGRDGLGAEMDASQITSDDNFAEAFTPEQAAEFAVLNHPSLRTIRDNRGLACAQIIQAGILANPKLDASFDTPAFGATADTVTADTQSVSWDISQLRPRSAKLRAAAANVASVDMDIVWQEWQFAQTARQAVYDLAALENQLQVLTASQNGLEENLKIVEKAVDEGNLTLVELSAAESAAIASRANTLAARQQLQQQRVTLNRSLGRPPEAPVSVNPSIEFPDKLELPSDQELLAISEGRADVDAIRRSYESQEETLRAAIAAQIPTTSLILTRASDTSEVGTLGAGISIDLQWFDRNQGAIATETAQRNKVHDQYVQQVFLARSEVGSALVDIRWLEEQIATVQQAIPVFQKLVDTYDKAVKEKNANAVVYYLAFNDLIQQQLELWRLRRQLIDARIALETAVGFPIDN